MNRKLKKRITEVLEDFSYEDLSKNEEELFYLFRDVKARKFDKEKAKDKKFGVKYLDKLYGKNKEFKSLVAAFTKSVKYILAVYDLEEKEKLDISGNYCNYDITYSCRPVTSIKVPNKFLDITFEQINSLSFSEWWISNIVPKDDNLKNKGIYRVQLLPSGDDYEYEVSVDVNKQLIKKENENGSSNNNK